MTTKQKHDATGLDAVSPATHPSRSAEHFRRIIAAAELVDAANVELRAAVAAARAAGDSWAVIGAALGTTRQAAFQRFGDPEEPDAEARARAAVRLVDAIQRAQDLAAEAEHLVHEVAALGGREGVVRARSGRERLVKAKARSAITGQKVKPS
jgi:hypothetical protein